MSSTIKFQSLTESDITTADVVNLFDPRVPGYSQQLYGQDSVAAGRAPDAPARRLNVLEVEVDSTSDSDLQKMINMVESIKGRLPLEVLQLRKPK